MNEKVILSVGVQLTIVIFSSLAAVHILTQMDTQIQIDGVPIYYYFTHVLAIILLLSLYSAMRIHNHPGSVYLALFFSILLPVTWLVLSLASLFPYLAEAFQPLTPLSTDQTKQLFPIITFTITAMIGIYSAIIAPKNRGKCFVIFLFVLALPAIFAESVVDWPLFFQDMAGVCERMHISALAPLFSIFQGIFILLTSNSRVNQFELYAICFGLLAGYIVLRHATRIALIQQELSKRGASTSDTASISRGVITIAAMAATSIAPVAFAATLAPLVAPHLVSTIQPLLDDLPELTLLLGIGTGTIALATIYIFIAKSVDVPLHEARGRTSVESDQAPLKQGIDLEEALKKYPRTLFDKYVRQYPHNPEGVLEWHIHKKMNEGKTREQAVKELKNTGDRPIRSHSKGTLRKTA